MKQVTSNGASQPSFSFDKRFWQGFLQLADPMSWLASTVPMFVGAALVIGQGENFSIFWFIVALISLYFVETGKNAVNEWVDYRSGVDLYVSPDNRTPFSGGKKTLIDSKLALNEVFWISIATLSLGFIVGLLIVFFKEPQVFWLGIVGIAIAIFYTAPPFRFAYRGFGELSIAIAFGPIIVSGVYILMTGTFDPILILISLPIAILIASVIWINEYPDYEADKKGNKKNMLVRLGKEKGIYVYIALYALAYVFMVLIAIVTKNPFWLLGLLTAPTAYKATKVLQENHHDSQKLMPANGMTLKIYLLTGILLSIAALTELFF